MLSDQKVSRLFLIPSLMKNMISYMKLEGISLPSKVFILTNRTLVGPVSDVSLSHSNYLVDYITSKFPHVPFWLNFSSVDLIHWESTGEPLSMEVAKTFFDFFQKDEKTKNVLCNIYGGTEMMDNLYEVFNNWDEVVFIIYSTFKNNYWNLNFSSKIINKK